MKIEINLSDNEVSIFTMYLQNVCDINIVDKSAIKGEVIDIIKNRLKDMADYTGNTVECENETKLIGNSLKLLK